MGVSDWGVWEAYQNGPGSEYGAGSVGFGVWSAVIVGWGGSGAPGMARSLAARDGRMMKFLKAGSCESKNPRSA